jgi:hypothetical protein
MTHLASTLVVCGGFLLLVPAEASAAAGSATATFAFALATAPATPASQQLTGGALDTEPADSSDNDDDDDVVGGDAAIAVGSSHALSSGDPTHLIHVDVEWWLSHTMDGHSLRGPPRGNGDESAVDVFEIDRFFAGRTPLSPASRQAHLPFQGDPAHQLTGGALDTDPPDSSDDDDDDDVLGGDAAISAASRHAMSSRDRSVLLDPHAAQRVSHAREGHSLRGPPPWVDSDASGATSGTGRRFDADRSPLRAAVLRRAHPPTPSARSPAGFRARHGQSLRAPP